MALKLSVFSCSLLHLTRLSITQGCFDSVAWAEDRDCESPLQEILLRKVDLHCGWVATAFQPLKRLQVLEIVSCPVQKKKSSRLQPIGSLRYGNDPLSARYLRLQQKHQSPACKQGNMDNLNASRSLQQKKGINLPVLQSQASELLWSFCFEL